jgi:hypothetical protein
MVSWNSDDESKNPPIEKRPDALASGRFRVKSLTMTYSHMGKPHTTIGAKSFHF